MNEALTADPGVEQIVGFQGGPPFLEYLESNVANDSRTEHPLSGLDVGAAVPLRTRLTLRAGPVAVESALTVPPAGLVFSKRDVFGLPSARDVETVAAEEGVGERLETTLGSTGDSIRHETEGEEDGIGEFNVESEKQTEVDGMEGTVKEEGNGSIYIGDQVRRHPHNHKRSHTITERSRDGLSQKQKPPRSNCNIQTRFEDRMRSRPDTA